VLALVPIGIFYWYQLFTAINVPIFDDYGVILSFLNHITDSNSFLEKINLLFGKYAEHRLFFTRLVAWLDYNIFGEVSFIRLGLIGNLGIIWIVWILFKSFKADQYRWWFFFTDRFYSIPIATNNYHRYFKRCLAAFLHYTLWVWRIIYFNPGRP